MSPSAISRRHFLIGAALATATLPISMRLLAQTQVSAPAGALPRLPLDNPQAKALGYTEDGTTSKHPSYKADSECSNCQFFTAATGACSVFPGFSVSPKGWCSVWSKRPTQ